MRKSILSMLFAFAMMLPIGAQALEKTAYTAEAEAKAKAQGCSVFLDFGASW